MKQGTIVIVEDNPDDEALMLRAFKQHKLANEIVVLRDGVEAVEYLLGTGAYAGRDTTVQPQVVLLDLKLPKLNGLDVLKRLRENPRTKILPVVVLTTSQEEGDMIASYNLGANSYVTKPVDFTKFAESVKQLGLYWLLLNQTPERIAL
ncbi:MAG: response regulator [Nitrospira sp.]|nr:response regulator [Nitrospira sp.]